MLSHPSTGVSYIIWYGFLMLSHPINGCFAHLLVWVVRRWSHRSPVVSCIISNGILHLSRSSTVALYISWYEWSFIGLIHQQLFRASSGRDLFISRPSTVVFCIIWYGKSLIGLIHQQLFRTSSGMDSIICLVHRQLFCT